MHPILLNKIFLISRKIKEPGNIAKIFLVITLIFYFAFGSYHLTKFFTTDEHYWIHERTLQYWQAIRHKDWKATMINDKPGITVAYISGIGLFWELHPDLYVKKVVKHVTQYAVEHTERLNLIFRLPILIFNGLFSVFLFWIFWRNTNNRWVALWAFIFILSSPILIGISRIVNPDSLLWIFSTASIFSYFAYLKFSKIKYATLTAGFLGLAILTKYTAVFLFPFLFVALLYNYFLNFQELKIQSRKTFNIKKLLISYFLIVAVSLIIFCLLMPAAIFGKLFYYQKTIVEILSQSKIIFGIIIFTSFFLLLDAYFFKNRLTETISELIGKTRKIWTRLVYLTLAGTVIFILFNWMADQIFINFDNIPFDARRDNLFIELPIYKKFILELYPVVFSLSPLIILSLLYIWIKSLFSESKLNNLIFLLSLFVITYYAAVIKNNLLATIRYSIVIYPILIFIAAIGIYEFWQNHVKKGKVSYWLTISLILISFSSVWKASPFYFDYTNLLLPKKYLISGSWGEGGYEAAQYLNSLPNADKLTVWADYSGVCEFFKGTCIKLYKIHPHNYKIDYYVLTRRGKILYEPDRKLWKRTGYVDAYKYYEKNNPEWSLEIGDRPGNYIYIYKAEK